MLPWLLVAGFGGLVLGFVLGAYIVSKLVWDEVRELREIFSPGHALAEDAPAQDAEKPVAWPYRVSPQRYLESQPEGVHAAQARAYLAQLG